MDDLKESVSLPSVPWNFMKTIQLIHVSNYGTKQRFSIQHSSMTREEFSKPQGIHPKWTCLHSPSSLSLPASQRPSATAQRNTLPGFMSPGATPSMATPKSCYQKFQTEISKCQQTSTVQQSKKQHIEHIRKNDSKKSNSKNNIKKNKVNNKQSKQFQKQCQKAKQIQTVPNSSKKNNKYR